MKRALRRKYITEALILFLFCAIGVFVFSWFRVWIVGELDTKQFRQIIDLLPNDWRKMAPVDFDWIVSYLGRTALTLDEPLLVMLVCAWAMVRGSDVVSGEVSRGTMEMLLAQPVSRKQVYWTHARWTLIGLLLLMLLVLAGMSLGIWSTSVEESTYPEIRVPLVGYRIPLTFLEPQRETIAMASQVNPIQFLPGILNLFCLGIFLAGFSAFCSSWDRYRWRTLGIVVVFYFANAMLKLGGLASESFAWMGYFTIFGLYEPATSIELADLEPGHEWFFYRFDEVGYLELAPMGNNIVLLILGLLCFWWGARIFVKRDLPAPV